MKHSAICVGTVGVALLLAADRQPSSASARSAPRVTCVAATRAGPFAPERSLAAVRRALRPQRLTNQGGTIHLTPRNYAVDEVAWLDPGAPPDTPQRRYLDLVRARCGERQSESTWLVAVTLTQAQLVLRELVLLATPTRDGWRVVLQSYRTG